MVQKIKMYMCFALLFVGLANISYGQQSLAKELRNFESYEDKKEFYLLTTIHIDSVRELLELEQNDLNRLELLLFYVDRQFKLDITKGEKEAKEALLLSKRHALWTQMAMSYYMLGVNAASNVTSNLAFLYLDSAKVITKRIDDKILESTVFFGYSLAYRLSKKDRESVKSLLSGMELIEEYGSGVILNHRLINLVFLGDQYNNPKLIIKALDKIQVQYLNSLTFNQYLNYKLKSEPVCYFNQK